MTSTVLVLCWAKTHTVQTVREMSSYSLSTPQSRHSQILINTKKYFTYTLNCFANNAISELWMTFKIKYTVIIAVYHQFLDTLHLTSSTPRWGEIQLYGISYNQFRSTKTTHYVVAELETRDHLLYITVPVKIGHTAWIYHICYTVGNLYIFHVKYILVSSTRFIISLSQTVLILTI